MLITRSNEWQHGAVLESTWGLYIYIVAVGKYNYHYI